METQKEDQKTQQHTSDTSKVSGTSNFYLVDFLKNLLRTRNIPMILYLLVDAFFAFCGIVMIIGLLIENYISNEGVFTVICLTSSLLVYFGTIALSLSFIGEAFLRFKFKCKEIADVCTLSCIEPIFNEVYRKAKLLEPSISDGIKLFIQEDDEPNAFAIGRKTICVTTGLLSCNDNEIRAVLAHEFGHLAHKDTDAMLVMNVANTFMNLIFLLVWAIIWVLKILFGIFSLFFSFGGDSVSSIVTKIGGAITTAIAFLGIKLVQYIWNYIGNLCISLSSRGAEFRADEFSQNLGYGEALIEFLKSLPDADGKFFSKIKRWASKFATIGKSHPATWRRIERLEQNVQNVNLKLVSETETNFSEISDNE